MNDEIPALSEVEIFDIVDENDNIIRKASREEAHSNPDLIHRVVHFLVLNKQGQVLAELRSRKKHPPKGIWVFGFGGHVPAGESVKNTALREIEEELGIKVKPLYIGKYLLQKPNETELVFFYVCTHEGPFELDPRETEKVKFINFFDLTQLPGWEDPENPPIPAEYVKTLLQKIEENEAKICKELNIKQLTLNTKTTTTPAGEIIN